MSVRPFLEILNGSISAHGWHGLASLQLMPQKQQIHDLQDKGFHIDNQPMDFIINILIHFHHLPDEVPMRIEQQDTLAPHIIKLKYKALTAFPPTPQHSLANCQCFQ